MERFSLEDAQNEAEEMKKAINDGYATDYNKAEKLLYNNYDKAPQEWKEFYDSFTKLRDQLLKKIFSLDDAKKKEFHQRKRDFEKEAFNSVSDIEDR